MSKQTIPLRITIEVDDEPANGVRVREVDGGVVLDVPRDLAKLLIDFGWQPPVDTLVGE